jgi:hypothetical protein
MNDPHSRAARGVERSRAAEFSAAEFLNGIIAAGQGGSTVHEKRGKIEELSRPIPSIDSL